MDKNPRPPGQSANAEYPEIPFDKDWAELVRLTRKNKGMSQDELAEKAGVTQPMISGIESFTSQQSRAVVPICRVLGIAFPRAYSEDDRELQWRVLGTELRRESPEAFEDAFRFLSQVVRGRTKS